MDDSYRDIAVNKENRIHIWISSLRIIATLAIIWLHISGTIWGNQDLFHLNDSQARFFSVNYYLMHWAVPVFFMLTGTLLLKKDKTITYKAVIRKYVCRMILALLVFGTGYALIMLIASGDRSIWILGRALRSVLYNETFSHLWYCYEMIGIYLILPLLKSFVNHTEEKNIRLFCIILLVFDFIIPFASVLCGNKIYLYLPLSYSVFYIVMGYLLDNGINRFKCIYLIGGVSIVIVAVIAYFEPIEGNPLLGYESPMIAIMAMLFFALFRNSTGFNASFLKRKEKELLNQKLLWDIDRLCFGVYLIHPFYIQVFYRIIGFTPISFRVYQLGTIVIWFLVTVLSFVTSWILRHIVIFRRFI